MVYNQCIDENYPFAVVPFADEDFIGFRVFLIDIPAVESIGKTPEEALAGLDEARKEWFAFATAKGITIPQPDPVFAQMTDYSGRVTLRIPKSLHRQVTERAVLEGISLNAYLNAAIQRGLHI
ncbi:MAG: type II toxin-antitoxin system HicB family antitoxin [Coriobacteriales bacterium]|jgi:predicted RNase H-like HicB family nuclease|nr:type II toxin-antitoxin system HicB family antitoxin [Coriobacteriales bacterium]